MEISDKKLDDFIEIYRVQFGVEIGRKEAYDEAMRLLTLLQMFNRPVTKKDAEEYEAYNHVSLLK
jgi:hypothetical protein